MVAGIALVLVRRAYGPDASDGPAELIWFGRALVAEHAARAEKMPDPYDGPPSSLIGRIIVSLRDDPPDTSLLAG